MSQFTKRTTIYIVASLCILFIGLYSLHNQQCATTTLTVDVDILDSDSGNWVLLWSVKNNTSEILEFEQNNIAQISVNGKAYPYETSISTLNPYEIHSFEVTLFNMDIDVPNTIRITATTNIGTAASINQTIYPQEEQSELKIAQEVSDDILSR